MTTAPPPSPQSSDSWHNIFERQMELAQWGPRHPRGRLQTRRVRWAGRVRIRVGRRIHTGTGINLSEQGTRIEGSFEAPMGSTVSVTFELFGQLVHAVGVCAGVFTKGRSRAYEVHFSVMRRSARRRLSNYVAAHAHTHGSPGSPSPCTGGETMPHRVERATPHAIPLPPLYVPVRTGQTESIDLTTGEHRRLDGRDHGPPLERMATLG